MKKIKTIAFNLLLRLFRSGSIIGFIITLSLLGIFIFSFSRSDGDPISELQIRVRYTLYFVITALNIGILYIACTTLRRDLEKQNFHMVSSAPITRRDIWLGNFLGLWIFGVMSFIAVSIVITVSAFIYTKHFNTEQQTIIKKHFLQPRFVARPLSIASSVAVNDELKRRHLAGKIPKHTPLWQVRKNIIEELQKKEQMVNAHDTKEWRFHISPARIKGDYLILKTKFFTNKKRKRLSGVFTLRSRNSPIIWTHTINDFPFMFHEYKIPINSFPKGSDLTLHFQNNTGAYVIFPHTNGMAILYENSSLLGNFISLLFFVSLNLATLIALSLMLASMFTYSVAIFVTIITYIIGLSSGFFANVIRDLTVMTPTFSEYISIFFIKTGLYLTKGIHSPDVVKSFSAGYTIPVKTLLQSWGGSFIIYSTLLVIIGIFILTRKEIDKILHS
jgi:hypothetical protein